MHDRKARWPRLAEVVIVGLICGLLSCCLWPVVRDSRGPSGDPIPEEPPDESNRIQHPAGFSVVVPPNWDASDRGSLILTPKSPGRYARRSRALLVISPIGRDRPPELESMAPSVFQGQVAYERMKVVRKDTFDDPPLSEYQLYLQRDGNWYLVTYSIAEVRTTLPAMVRRYIGTLRWDGGDFVRPHVERHREGLLSLLHGWPPRPPELAAWPDELRERWGRRAAELEATGLCWRLAERRSFEELRAEAAGGTAR
jgi:hypothetical protein